MDPDNIEKLKQQYPDVDLNDLFKHFPRLSMVDYPELKHYTWEGVHKGALGSGALFLAADLARLMQLTPGMRVLELGSGNGSAACFLAKHFGVQVVAVDHEVDPSEVWQQVSDAGLEKQVMPLALDARNLPFPHEYFDAVFCMNSYFYFGTDDLYLHYLAPFVKPGGQIGIAGPCYDSELTPETSLALLDELSYAWHSPQWWRNHFERSGLTHVQHCEAHPKGRDLWLDDTRWHLESTHPMDHNTEMRDLILWAMVMVMSDTERFVTHFMLNAQVLP